MEMSLVGVQEGSLLFHTEQYVQLTTYYLLILMTHHLRLEAQELGLSLSYSM